MAFMRLPRAVHIPGIGDVEVSSQQAGQNTFVTVETLKHLGINMQLPFSSAVISSDGTIHVSGMVAFELKHDGKPGVVTGGPGSEALRVMQIIEATLHACGARIEDVVMVRVFLVDYTTERFADMNEGYLKFWGSKPLPARICTGATHVGLGASVEVDVVAKVSVSKL